MGLVVLSNLTDNPSYFQNGAVGQTSKSDGRHSGADTDNKAIGRGLQGHTDATADGAG